MAEADGADDPDRAEELYDLYVEAALGGAAPDPAAFLAAHDCADAALRVRLERVHATCGAEPTGSDAAAQRAPPGAPFERLGRYRVLRTLGEGGMGAVLLGEDEELGRLVALKLLRPELQGSTTLAARFEREAQVVARLRHPHVVRLYGVGEEGGTRFLAMEFVEGEGLDEVLARARDDGDDGVPPPVETCVRWAAQLAGALQAAHEAGVVHRDVKPSNVRITPAGDAVLLDFGVAAEEGAGRLTRTGRFLGTSAYAAPERFGPGAGDDPRGDVWSLGVVLYEALTGVQPFEGASEAETLRRVLETEPPSPRRLRPAVPHDLALVVATALERDPSRRYASAAAFADDLRAVLAARPVAARGAGPLRRTLRAVRRRPVASASLALLVAGAAALLVARTLERRAEAAAALDAAQRGVVTFRAEAAAARESERALAWLEKQAVTTYTSAAEDAELARVAHEVQESRRRREAAFHGVLGDLARATLLGAYGDRVDAATAALYREGWREARLRHDDGAAAFYARRVRELAGGDAGHDVVAGEGRVTVVCDAPGATARIYRYELDAALRAEGEPRLVPVAVGVAAPSTEGCALRLLADHGSLAAGDLVVGVGGERVTPENAAALAERLAAGASAAVLDRGAHRTLELPPGARVRVTTQPLAWEGTEALGADVRVAAGDVLVVVRAPGREEARRPLHVLADTDLRIEVALEPAGTTPAGCVPIRDAQSGDVLFRMRETEVLAGEYLEFLNDAATRAEIDASPTLVRAPRSPATRAAGGHWPRGADGLYALPADWPADWPVLGVSCDDAEAFCRWWSARAAARGAPWRARLPTIEEWATAAGTELARDYAFGNQFRAKWVASCFARPRAAPSAALAYPRDETPSGLFDTAGGVTEWTASTWGESARTRRTAGGSWADPRPESFRIWGGQGIAPDVAGDEFGFRFLVESAETR